MNMRKKISFFTLLLLLLGLVTSAQETTSEILGNVSDSKGTPLAGATVTAFDPEAMNNVRNLIGGKINYAENQYEALQGANALIIATEWNEFRTPDFLKIVKSLKSKAIFDGRNLFDVSAIRELGFHYESIGRSNN